jgi:hypothetical protein
MDFGYGVHFAASSREKPIIVDPYRLGFMELSGIFMQKGQGLFCWHRVPHGLTLAWEILGLRFTALVRLSPQI